MRAILAGGGTGGHVIPALAIAHELKNLFDAEVRFVGTARGIENRLVPAAGFGLDLIEIGALKKVSLATRLKTVFALPSAILQARRILAGFRPDVVVGVGGYASGPVMIAAAMLSIPMVSFEPNVVPGLANRVAAPLVTAAAVHFQETCRYFRRCRVTGVPVRSQFFEAAPKEANEPSTLLVFGGSQGAHAINQAVIASLPLLQARCPGLRIIHQTGEKDYLVASTAYLNSDIAAEVSPFIDEMPHAFARADLVLCRSGASTVAEITAAGKPAIFVPFPHAADDHQRRNAEALVRAGAALMIVESELTPQLLEVTIGSLLGDRARLASMSAAAKKLSHPHAAREIAVMAARLAGLPAPPPLRKNAGQAHG
jgi:UDP-N-acetylglucosamine--N-acetylmuramyl-(pentapeptide) pyrophosphoryl-undecaprenol N-acetylglucosamine transferase